ncbi:class C sortase [Corynebacterium sp. YIM 101645]|uniref:Class C sortase n=1 Tax=Corynebacterium lemuris TaxID=1859292 RepID=A0ABT2FU57_9CORY|nr:class C sortase [Corynebacterium lemuris]MCS5478768.1 class C sortase [Corynebacterium lemuris]
MTALTEPQHDNAGKKPSSARPRGRDRWIPLLLVIAGILVLTYPVVATYLRNSNQAAVVDAYRDSLVKISREDRSDWLDRARRYNEQNTGAPILDPWLNRVSKENAPYRDYLEELNPGGEDGAIMAALSIPAIDVRLPVYHGTEMDTLHEGVGHLYGSALPVGGDGTHSVLTGHTGLTTATMFDNLGEIQEGDAFYLEVLGESFKYEVDQIKVVLPDEIDDTQPVAGRDLVTLITCTPYGVNSHRLLVRGTRVPVEDAEAEEAFTGGSGLWQPWMIGVLVVVALVLLTIGALFLRARRRKRATEPDTGRGGRHRVR